MKINLKALLTVAFALAVSLPASAQTTVGVHVGAPAPYYPELHVQPRFEPAPVYYAPERSYVDSGWRDRRDWRERREARWRRAELHRREEWRREQWEREQWEREQWRDHGHRRNGRD